MKQIEYERMKRKDISFDDVRGSKFDSKLSKEKRYIREIIGSSINLQAVLGNQYIYKRDLDISSTIDSTFYITNNIKKEIKMFGAIFNDVFIIKKENSKEPFSIQVSNASDLACEVFAEMLAENQIDSCIKHFVGEKPIKQDFCKDAYFEIEKNKSEIVKNKYFEYLIEGTISPTMINPMYIDVSCLSIEEIEKDEYVQQLAAQVKHLYLIVFQQETPECSFYTKHLRWYI